MLLADSITDNMTHTTEGEDNNYSPTNARSSDGPLLLRRSRSRRSCILPPHAASASAPSAFDTFRAARVRDDCSSPARPGSCPSSLKASHAPVFRAAPTTSPIRRRAEAAENGQSRPSPGEPDRRSTRSAHGDPRDPAILPNSGASTTLHAFFGPGRNVTLRRDPGGGGGGGLGPVGPGGGGPAGGAAPLPRPR